MFTELTKLMDGFFEMGIPFYDCIVMKDGKCVYRHANGYTDINKKTEVTGKELYNIYSCSKLITWLWTGGTKEVRTLQRCEVILVDTGGTSP